MPRKQRIQYPGAIYHIMSRGDRREDIFLDDVDRYDFIKSLAEACQKTSWQVHDYCLMSNHFHLVIETHGNQQECHDNAPPVDAQQTDDTPYPKGEIHNLNLQHAFVDLYTQRRTWNHLRRCHANGESTAARTR